MIGRAESETPQGRGETVGPSFEGGVAESRRRIDDGLGVRAALGGDRERASDAAHGHPRRPPVIMRRKAGDRRGSSVSRMPSPSRLKASTVIVMARPG